MEERFCKVTIMFANGEIEEFDDVLLSSVDITDDFTITFKFRYNDKAKIVAEFTMKEFVRLELVVK